MRHRELLAPFGLNVSDRAPGSAAWTSSPTLSTNWHTLSAIRSRHNCRTPRRSSTKAEEARQVRRPKRRTAEQTRGGLPFTHRMTSQACAPPAAWQPRRWT